MSDNLETLGYSQAAAGDSLEQRAREAMNQIPGFPEDVSQEARAALYRGYTRRYSENNPPVVYAVVDGHYVTASPEMLTNKKVEKAEIGVAYALSFSTHEYGKLASENPALRKVVEKIRTDTLDYCSNRLGDLRRTAKKLLRKDNGGTTRETLTFEESAKKVFDAWEKSVKTKAGRGDVTANVDRFKAAVAAFWKAYKV